MDVLYYKIGVRTETTRCGHKSLAQGHVSQKQVPLERL